MKSVYLNEKEGKAKMDTSKVLLVVVIIAIVIANVLNAISIIL